MQQIINPKISIAGGHRTVEMQQAIAKMVADKRAERFVKEVLEAGQRQHETVRVDVMGDRNATVATASYDAFRGTGSAKRAPGDPYDKVLGEGLAIGRALKALGEQMIEDWTRETEL